MLMLLYILLPILAFILIFMLVGALLSAPRYKGPVTDHFDGKEFKNPNGQVSQGLGAVFKWMRTRKRDPWPKAKDWSIPEKSFDQPGGIRVTFVNHSTFLIQVGEFNILTDPVWSQRVSPFSFMGPARKRPPGVRLEDLPNIDLVLLSHNHYDHLDKQTLKTIHQVHRPQVLTPLGVGAYAKKIGMNPCEDLDWWQSQSFHDHSIKITALPASHFSSRGTLDRNATLWCGFFIESELGNVYFAGDSGFGEFFNDIAERTADMDIALLPIGAYKPEWFMSPIHTSPSEAVKVHKILNPGISIASHFGTFPLADDNTERALNDLKAAKTMEDVAEEKFITLDEGRSFEFNLQD